MSAVKVAETVTTATYLISLISDKESFHDLQVSFSTSIARQDSSLYVSYLAPGDIPLAPPSPSRSSTQQERQFIPPPEDTPPSASTSSLPRPEAPPISQTGMEGVSDEIKTSIAAIITIFAIIIATVVICLAVRQSSSRSQGGFSAHLPKTPSQQAFSLHSPQSTATPGLTGTPGLSGMTGYQTPNYANQRTPPIPGQAGSQSAFRRPGFSPSPQHTLFSQ